MFLQPSIHLSRKFCYLGEAPGVANEGGDFKTQVPWPVQRDFIDWLFADDYDLDGVPDWRDELHGTNDNAEKIKLGDGTVVAEIITGLWAVFDAGGMQQDGFFNRVLTSYTTGGWSYSINGGIPSGIGGQFSYQEPQGIYTLTRVEPPAEFIVEGTPY